MADEPTPSRRRLLRIAGGGSAVALAGCINTPVNGYEPYDRAADWCLDELDESVPEAERTASSIDGIERKAPEDLQSKEEAGYTCTPVDGMQCGNCRFYIDDKTGDAVGACTEVAGEVRSVDWCGLWQPRDEMS